MVNQQRHSTSIAPIVQFSNTVATKQVATAAMEITKIKLIALGGAAHISVYDTATGDSNPVNLRWALDASTTYNDTDDFIYPLAFKRGIYLTCDDGKAFNPQVCISYIP